MTPFHLGLRVVGHGKDMLADYKRTLYGAWHSAAMYRVDIKRFPSLEKLLTPAEQPKQRPEGVDEVALKEAFQRHNIRLAAVDGENR